MHLTKYRPTNLRSSFMSPDWFFRFPTTVEGNGFEPNVDVVEREKDYLLTVELPGVSKEELKVTVKDGYLTISGEKKSEKTEDGDTWQRTEIRYGSFNRSFRLGSGIDKDKIKSEYKNGVLNVIVPKEKSAQKKEIEIKVS